MNLPKKGDQVFFPRQLGELVKIAWYQNNQYCQAEYYRTPAYVSNSTNQKNPYETVLFIARERFDDVYYHVPEALSSLQIDHVKKIEIKAKKDETEAEKAVPDKWIQCEINDKFFYGQDDIKNPSYRWLVYHPKERQPAQGRFIEAKPQLIVGNLISIVPSVQTPAGGLTINFDETTTKNVQSWGVRLFGHRLHQFGKDEGKELELAAETTDKIRDATKNLIKGSELEQNIALVGMLGGVAGMQMPKGKTS